ncbi:MULTISPECIES: OprD family outer membrane porin [Pseudomonas]|uniref:OprD family outer membrane porin n=1 Tax=Pseudomonas sp. Hg7Tf TaxID=3236988 RepID=A0AB39IBP4_9PSED|nr:MULTISPECIES: OprD family outer membrane porin [Pseudomonas]KJK05882.1 porin [Pseudomonas sp. 5]MDD1979656.1 OprD family porin [Pseudomonas putida]MDH2558807.1 OprD family outer membrane porin [Pseudomonas sp. Hg5Tf]QYX49401.1 OprD family porin [Pseudomonas sp. S11A 273]
MITGAIDRRLLLLPLSWSLLWALPAEADNAMGQKDTIFTGVNDRQAVELAIAPGLVQGSRLDGVLRNYYFQRDNHSDLVRRDPTEWAQGFLLSFRSGFTDTPIGVGVDAHAFLGLKLDGGGGSGGAGLLPLDASGAPEDEFSSAGAALKLRYLDTLVKAGDQLVENPLVGSGTSRLFPQGYRGVTLKNHSLNDLWLDAGFVESTRLRNQSGHSHLVTAYGAGTADRESPHVAWLGGSYNTLQGLQLTVYGGQLEDIWDQYYLGISERFQVGEQLTLKPYLHWYRTTDQGRSQLGRIDNDTYSGGIAATAYGQTLILGLQKVDGRTPFDYLTQDDRIFLYLSNSQQFADFNGPGEKSWRLQYETNLSVLDAPSMQLIVAYTRGEADLTRVDPNSIGYGYIYNPDGKDAKHWERDVALKYVVPAGAAKDLSLTLRWATHREGDGYTAPGNTRGNSSADEYRLIVDYPVNFF